jgi:hypothetical protein
VAITQAAFRRGPGQHHLPRRQTRRHYRPKQINDPLSEALASVANEVHKVRERVQQLEGAGVPYEPLPESLQRIMEDLDLPDLAQRGLTWTAQSGRRTSDVGPQTSELRRQTAGDTAA